MSNSFNQKISTDTTNKSLTGTILPDVLKSWYAFGGTFIGSFLILWGIVEPLGLTTGWSLWVALIILSLILASSVYSWGLYLAERNKNELIKSDNSGNEMSFSTSLAMVNDNNYVLNQLQSCSLIRLFASGSETYRLCLLSILPQASLRARVEIRVLLRDDGSSERRAKIQEACRKWQEIDDKYNTRTIIRLYHFNIMFRGWLFDNDTALIGWYERKDSVTLGQDDSAFILTKGHRHTDNLIKMLIDTFDKLFGEAKECQ